MEKLNECLGTMLCAILLVIIFLMIKNCVLDKMEFFSKGRATVDEKDAIAAMEHSQWGRVSTESSPQLLNLMYDPRYKQYGEGRGMIYDN